MNPVRVGCCQFTAVPGDAEANVGRMASYVRDAAKDAVELLVFPELIITGYLSPDRIPGVAEPLDGSSVTALRAVGRDGGISLAFGMAQRLTSGECRNSLVYLDDRGEIVGVYHKMHLWDTERSWAGAGTEMRIAELGGNLVCGWICYDTRFPECARLGALAGADLALVATAWLGPADEWELALRARALDNSMYVAGADIIDSSIGCEGCSMIIDPKGGVVARAEMGREGLIAADLDPGLLDAQRERVPLLADRVPEHYVEPR